MSEVHFVACVCVLCHGVALKVTAFSSFAPSSFGAPPQAWPGTNSGAVALSGVIACNVAVNFSSFRRGLGLPLLSFIASYTPLSKPRRRVKMYALQFDTLSLVTPSRLLDKNLHAASDFPASSKASMSCVAWALPPPIPHNTTTPLHCQRDEAPHTSARHARNKLGKHKRKTEGLPVWRHIASKFQFEEMYQGTPSPLGNHSREGDPQQLPGIKPRETERDICSDRERPTRPWGGQESKGEQGQTESGTKTSALQNAGFGGQAMGRAEKRVGLLSLGGAFFRPTRNARFTSGQVLLKCAGLKPSNNQRTVGKRKRLTNALGRGLGSLRTVLARAQTGSGEVLQADTLPPKRDVAAPLPWTQHLVWPHGPSACASPGLRKWFA